jgi:hypothetical protein
MAGQPFATPVTAFGPQGTSWERDRQVIFRALGLPDCRSGHRGRFTAAESGSVEGVLYFVNPNTIGVRTAGALYRFLRGFGEPVVASHQLFAGGADPVGAERARESWLARVLGDTER